MKKQFLILALAAGMVFGATGCASLEGGMAGAAKVSETETAKELDDVKVDFDFSKYPADFKDWTMEDLNNYFVEAGVYPDKDNTFVQDHDSYYDGTPVGDGCGYANDSETITILIFNIADPSKEAGVDEFKQYVIKNHELGDDLGNIPVDHMIGDLMFYYSGTVDKDAYAAFEKAYSQLVKGLELTQEF